MTTVATLLSEARELVLKGDLDAGEQKKNQAAALKSIEELTPKVDESKRPAFGDSATKAMSDEAESPMAMAVKSAYVKKFGDIDAGAAQVLRELYGTDNYPMLRAMKMADLNRYLRTNIADPRYQKMVLLSPDQIFMALANGVPVSDGNYTIKATMMEAQDQLGGYLVPEDINEQMINRLPGLTAVRPLASKYSTSRDRLSFMVRQGGTKQYIGNIRSKQTSEAPSTAATFQTNALFGKIEIPVHVNLSNVPVTKSLLEDSAIDIMNGVLMPEFVSEAAIKEDTQFLTGSGVNEPQGILNGTAANGAPFNSDVATRNSGAASTLTFDAVVAMPWDIAGQYRQRKNPSTAWVFNSNTGGVLSGLKNGIGDYLWTEMSGNNAVGNPDTLRGWQYKESEALANTAANVYPIIFGDFAGYRIVDRIGMSVQRYEDSNSAQNDSVIFYCRRRYGGQVAEGYRFVVMKVSA